MRASFITLICLALSSLPAHSQSLVESDNGIVVGQIRTEGVSANAVFGYFESDDAVGIGGVCFLDGNSNASSIERTEANKSIGFSIDGRTIRIDAENASNGVRIRTLDGRTVYAGKKATITLPVGVYLLSVNNGTQKIILR